MSQNAAQSRTMTIKTVKPVPFAWDMRGLPMAYHVPGDSRSLELAVKNLCDETNGSSGIHPLFSTIYKRSVRSSA